MTTQFYAYIHCKPDGIPFYVGKGMGNRATLFTCRTTHHKNIVAKYGKENITIWKFDCDDEQKAFALEIYMIAHYRRIGMPLCNLTDGGDGMSNPSPETRAKMSAARTGLKRSPESLANMSDAQTGRIHSPETRAKIAASLTGKIHSPESRARMSLAGQGKKRPPFTAEHRERLSVAGKKKILSADHRAKISDAGKGKIASTETRAKLREAWVIRRTNKAK